MNKFEQIIEIYRDSSFYTIDGFDDAIIGVSDRDQKLVYSATKCVDILTKDIPYDDALEYFLYNVSGGNDGGVIIVDDLMF